MSTAASTCALPPSSLLKFKHQSQMVNSSLSLSRRSASFTLQRISYIRCSSTGNGREKRASPLLQAAVSGATELLRLLFSGKKRVESGISEDSPATQVLCVDDVLRILRSDFDRAYFLTGDFSAELYDEDCIFEDPTIRFRGKTKYSQNLDLLVPFFDLPSLTLENIEKGKNNIGVNYIQAKWYLRTYLKFPWRPLITIRGITIYELDGDFKIIRHAENWNISALEAVGQIFNLTPLVVDE